MKTKPKFKLTDFKELDIHVTTKQIHEGLIKALHNMEKSNEKNGIHNERHSRRNLLTALLNENNR